MSKKRPWRIFIGAWPGRVLDRPSFYTGYATQARAERKARALIKRSLTTRKRMEMLSPVVVQGPKGITLRLSMDTGKLLVEEAAPPGEVLPSKIKCVTGNEEDEEESTVVTKTKKKKTKKKAKKAKKVLTTEELRERLAVKFPTPEWVLLNEVRDATGWEGNRTADCLALATWPSRGCVLYGFELKVSRTDVLKELKSPHKAEAFARYCDRWYLVLGSSDLIKESEVPANWGLIYPHGTGLRIGQESKLRDGVKWPREFVASMVRNAQRNQASVEELRKEFKRGQENVRNNATFSLDQAKKELKDLREKIKKFEELSGVTVLSDRYAWEGKQREEAGKIRAIMKSGAGGYFDSMSKLVLQMETLSRQVREQLVAQGTLPEKPSIDDLCPHPMRHGRHELYILSLPKGAKSRAKVKGKALPAHCRACGAEGEITL